MTLCGRLYQTAHLHTHINTLNRKKLNKKIQKLSQTYLLILEVSKKQYLIFHVFYILSFKHVFCIFTLVCTLNDRELKHTQKSQQCQKNINDTKHAHSKLL